MPLSRLFLVLQFQCINGCYSFDEIGVPFKLETPLKFCGYEGTVCCDTHEDLHLQKQFEEMDVSDPACASVLKSVLCAVSFLKPR